MNRYIEDNVANAYAEYQKNDGILTFAEWHHLAPPHPTCNICRDTTDANLYKR